MTPALLMNTASIFSIHRTTSSKTMIFPTALTVSSFHPHQRTLLKAIFVQTIQTLESASSAHRLISLIGIPVRIIPMEYISITKVIHHLSQITHATQMIGMEYIYGLLQRAYYITTFAPITIEMESEYGIQSISP